MSAGIDPLSDRQTRAFVSRFLPMLLLTLACQANEQGGIRANASEPHDASGPIVPEETSDTAQRPVHTTGDTGAPPTEPPKPGNILILLLDDVGVDVVAAYGVGDDPPATPTLDQLAAEGVRFDHAWANPTCSPTRASLLTGLQPRHHGIWSALSLAGHTALSTDVVTLPEMLDAQTGGRYAHAAFGKWHLMATSSGPDHPNDSGFAWFDGTPANLPEVELPEGGPGNYYRYVTLTNGVHGVADGYATTATVDHVLDRAAVTPEPWMFYVAFHAGHTPYNTPPDSLRPPSETLVQRDAYLAVVEALDTEIDRLLGGLPAGVLERTTVLVIGDNGTPINARLAELPEHQAKKSIREGGVRVPFVVAGYRVERPGVVTTPVVVQDVFATVADLAGAPLVPGADPELDSVSLLPYLEDPDAPPQRATAYVERIKATEQLVDRAITDGRFKLVQSNVTGDNLYDLDAELWDETDLLEGSPSADALDAYDRLLLSMPYPFEEMLTYL